jgi:hypothetical protein
LNVVGVVAAGGVPHIHTPHPGGVVVEVLTVVLVVVEDNR